MSGVAVIAVIAAYVWRWDWTGLPSQPTSGGAGYKTAWDWLDLLIVPAALAALGFWFSSRERRTERLTAQSRARSETLLGYVDRMSDLIRDGNLPGSADDPSRAVARARTLTAAKQLDGAGRGVVLQFLYESGLIGGMTEDREVTPGIIDLTGGDFGEAKLDGIRLRGADLSGASLIGATMRGASLEGAQLRGTKLQRVDLRSGPPLYAANWTMSPSLIGADLSGADLTDGRLDASLQRAILRGARLNGADLGREQARRSGSRRRAPRGCHPSRSGGPRSAAACAR